MRPRFVPLLLMIGVFSLAGCGKESADQESPQTNQTPPTALGPDEQLYVKAADIMVDQFMRSLQSELLNAAKSGFTGAVTICNTKAPKLTRMYDGHGWSLKRVSDRFRNPNNRADSTEQTFLTSFADTTSTPPEFIVDWTESDSTKTLHYYRPIETKQICLNCHGDLQTMGTDTYMRIKKLYPMDRATGYKLGDLRGMFVVEGTWPDGDVLAQKIVSGELVEDINSSSPDSLLDSTAVDSSADSTEIDTSPAEG